MRFIFLIASVAVAPISLIGAGICFAGYLGLWYYQFSNDLL